MRCYYVLVHGTLDWSAAPACSGSDIFRPLGFYCHRYVLAADEAEAAGKAFRRVRENLARSVDWREAALHLEPDEVTRAPTYKLLKPDNRGHVFYAED